MLQLRYLSAMPVDACCTQAALLLQLLEINRQRQKQNNVPRDFPLFVRNGFEIKIVAESYTAAPNGLIYKVHLWHEYRFSQ